jgi:WD40 repeat protein
MREAAVVALTRWDAEPEHLAIPAGGVYARADANLEHVALWLDQRELGVLTVATGELTPVPSAGAGPPRWFSPDGSAIAVGEGWPSERTRIRVVDWRADRVLLSSPEHLVGSTAFAFLDDGRALLVDRRAEAWVGDPTTGAWERGPEVPAELRERGSPQYVAPQPGTPLGEARVLWARSYQRPWIWNVPSGEAVPLLSDESEAASIGWCAGGRLGAVGDLDGQLSLIGAGSGAARLSAQAHRGEIVQISADPSGQVLASYSWDHTTRIWNGALSAPVLELPPRAGRVPAGAHPRWPSAGLHGGAHRR